MIIWFSGTGNTRYVATELARLLHDPQVVELSGRRLTDPSSALPLPVGARVVWAFPVYSWGVPPVVAEIMRKAPMPEGDKAVHYMVATCGDDAGLTARQWRKLMAARGWKTAGAFTVEMPNTYTLMSGFDTDPEPLERKKLADAPARIASIAASITAGSEADETVRGRWAGIKSRVIYPWFCRFDMSPKPFHATEACTGCGMCARSCPMDNIAMNGQRPPRPCWADNCALCLRCYHICPVHAVAYGKATRRKGQFRHWLLKPWK